MRELTVFTTTILEVVNILDYSQVLKRLVIWALVFGTLFPIKYISTLQELFVWNTASVGDLNETNTVEHTDSSYTDYLTNPIDSNFAF